MKSEYALKANGESLCKDRARERIASRVSLKTIGASFGNNRRLTGTLNIEMSDSSHLSSPPCELRMMSITTIAAALPGVVLPCSEAGVVIEIR